MPLLSWARQCRATVSALTPEFCACLGRECAKRSIGRRDAEFERHNNLSSELLRVAVGSAMHSAGGRTVALRCYRARFLGSLLIDIGRIGSFRAGMSSLRGRRLSLLASIPRRAAEWPFLGIALNKSVTKVLNAQSGVAAGAGSTGRGCDAGADGCLSHGGGSVVSRSEFSPGRHVVLLGARAGRGIGIGVELGRERVSTGLDGGAAGATLVTGNPCRAAGKGATCRFADSSVSGSQPIQTKVAMNHKNADYLTSPNCDPRLGLAASVIVCFGTF
jgi:hypothetical protein